MRLAKKTVIDFISEAGKSAVGFIVTLYLARSVGTDILGKYFVVVALLTWLSVPINGVMTAMTKRISEGELKSEYFISGFIMNTVVVVLFSVLLVTFRHQVKSYIGAPVVNLLILLILTRSLFAHVHSGHIGKKKIARASTFQFMERLFRGGAQVGLVYAGYELGGIVIGHITSLLVIAVSGYMLYDLDISIPEREHFRSLWSYGRYSWLGSMKGRTVGWMDTIVLNFFVASSFVAVYEIAWTLASFLTIVSLSISRATFPEMSEMSSGDRYEEVQQLLDEAFTYSGIFAIPGFVGALVLGPEILEIYGPGFTKGSVILLMLITAKGIGAYENTLTRAIDAVNRPDITFKINLLMVITNVTLNVILIALFGWYGAAVATATSTGLGLVMGYWGISKVVGRPNLPVDEISKQVASAIVMGIVVYAASGIGSSVYHTVGLVLLGAVIYGSFLVAISGRFRKKVVSLRS